MALVYSALHLQSHEKYINKIELKITILVKVRSGYLKRIYSTTTKYLVVSKMQDLNYQIVIPCLTLLLSELEFNFRII